MVPLQLHQVERQRLQRQLRPQQRKGREKIECKQKSKHILLVISTSPRSKERPEFSASSGASEATKAVATVAT